MREFVTPDIWLKGGIVAPAHRRAMGVSIWVYLYVLGLVRFDGPEAGRTPKDKPYRHTEAAAALGVDVRSVKRDFEHLIDAGYLTAKRTQYGLHVAVTKYVAQAERSRKRPSRSDETDLSAPNPEVTEVSSRSDTSVRQKWQKCPAEVTETPLPIYKDARAPNYQTTKRPNEDDDAHAHEAASAATRTLDALDRFNATLVGAPGYQPVPDFLLKVRQKYGHLDLEEEAIKARDWARRHRRPCSHGYLLNWLKKAAAEKEALAAAAKPATSPKRPPRNEPPPLPGPVVPASPEVRAEYDAIRNGRRPTPPREGDPAEFARKRAAALAAAQARIGALP